VRTVVRTDESPGELAVHVAASGVTLGGTLGVPTPVGTLPGGVILFAHGSGSSRFSPRNKFVADILRESGFATLLLDLLTQEEESVDVRTRELRFDLQLLAHRLVDAIDWLAHQELTRELPIGLFGASTGAGAALMAAARRPEQVQAVVSRGGRPDLAGDALAAVHAPTLLIVGGDDKVVIDLNRAAMAQMSSAVRLEIVPGATHLFEERGALDAVANLARRWFTDYLAPPIPSPRS
jgi:putative phosphoribosyl transferase